VTAGLKLKNVRIAPEEVQCFPQICREYLLTRLVEMHAVVTEEGAVPRDVGMPNHPADVHTRYQLPPHSVHLLSLDLDSFL
tara:strand:- start:673 stop:915 length:243 start_codon:yes stop_codon:yes gene_type:complete